MRIQHNIAALNSHRQLTGNNNAVSKNLEKLSSGYRINRAGDDAAGLAISEKMRAQITGLKTAQKNANDGISLVQTAEGALTEVHSMLNRMVELADQSANGTYDNDVDRANLQKELDSLRSEIDRISEGTNFNGINLLDGSLASKGTTTKADVDLSKITGNLAGGLKTVDATKGQFGTTGAVTTASVATSVGDTFNASYVIKDSAGNEQTVSVELTIKEDKAGTGRVLVGKDGSEYGIAASAAPTNSEIAKAIMGELQKNEAVKSDFTLSENSGKITFEAKTAGTQGKEVTSVQISKKAKSNGAVTTYDNSITTTAAVDSFETLDLTKATVWDGKDDSLDKATFEINGEKFLFVENGKLNADTLAKLNEKGITHFVELAAASNGAVKNSDAAAMGQKIALETGLKVTTGSAVTTAGVTKWTEQADTTIALKSNTVGKAGGGLTLQIGDTSDAFNQLTVSVDSMSSKSLGIGGINISTQGGAAKAVDLIKAAINKVSSTRGDLGAIQNRLEHTINNLSVTTENMTAAESRIRDVDMAEEMMNYTKNNILVQASQAMLAQANQLPQGVLQLLQ